jgi:hypothetical protein
MVFEFGIPTCFKLFGRLAYGGFMTGRRSSQLGGVWSSVSYQKIFSPSTNLLERDSLFWLYLRGLDPLSLQVWLCVQAARQLWPVTGLLIIVRNSGLYVQSRLTTTASLP